MNPIRLAGMLPVALAASGLLASGLLHAAQSPAPQPVSQSAPAVKNDAQDVKSFLDAMSAIGGIFTAATEAETPAAASNKAEAVESDAGQTTEAATEQNGEPAAENKRRSLKNTMALITGGAAAGAAIGAATGKGSKGAIVGAAIGGAVGLIYDRATYKNPGKI